MLTPAVMSDSRALIVRTPWHRPLVVGAYWLSRGLAGCFAGTTLGVLIVRADAVYLPLTWFAWALGAFIMARALRRFARY